MRKIRFKGYNDLYGWVDGDSFIAPNKIANSSESTINAFVNVHTVDPFSVSEFTGRYDSLGVRLFENDIVEVNPAHYGSSGIERGVIFMDGTMLLHGVPYHGPVGRDFIKVGTVYEDADILLSPENLRYLKSVGYIRDEDEGEDGNE